MKAVPLRISTPRQRTDARSRHPESAQPPVAARGLVVRQTSQGDVIGNQRFPQKTFFVFDCVRLTADNEPWGTVRSAPITGDLRETKRLRARAPFHWSTSTSGGVLSLLLFLL